MQRVHVRAADWRNALLAAAEPCSRRQGLSALSAAAARPMPRHLVPVLLPALARLLQVLHSSGLPLPPEAACSAALAADKGNRGRREPEDLAQLRDKLARAGAIEMNGGQI
jgi:hypothetical protein